MTMPSRPVHKARAVPRLCVLMGATLAIGACAVQPTPIGERDLATLIAHDRAVAQAGVPGVSTPLTLEGAIARALKYNLDQRIRRYEESEASAELRASRFDMLPRLTADAGYDWRNSDLTRRAVDSVTGLPSLANPYISSDREHSTWDASLTWNVLDFGASYFTARENADRVLIAKERRRKAMHTLIQNVRTTYWRAVAAERLGDSIRSAIADAESALADSRTLSNERVRSPAESLRFQRNLLENLRFLEGIQGDLAGARIELASLIGVEPGTNLTLVEPADPAPAALAMSLPQMEDLALRQNADLLEQVYGARIATTETHRALLKLLPGLSFDYNLHHDDDRYLVNQQWRDAGARVTFNLFNLLSGPSQIKAARSAAAVAEARRIGLQMAVVTQVHLAHQSYDDALRQFARADALYDIDRKLAQLSVSQEQSQMAGRLDRVSSNLSLILSAVHRYQAIAKIQESASRIQATLGLEPTMGDVDHTDLPTLERQVSAALAAWGARTDAGPAGGGPRP